MNNVLRYFPQKIKVAIEEEIKDMYDFLEEIRIRVDKPIILKFNNLQKIVRYKITPDEILNILQLVCENSIYSYQNQIANGFVTVNGGHRVGVSGSCVIENEKVININYINSLNFRISRQVLGCSNSILKHILNLEENTVYNTFITRQW